MIWVIPESLQNIKTTMKRTTKILSVDLMPSRKDSYFGWDKQSSASFHCCAVVLSNPTVPVGILGFLFVWLVGCLASFGKISD